MEKYYSKIEPDKLLHIIYRYDWSLYNMENSREDIIEPDNFIQCSALYLNDGKTFKPHKHIMKTVTDYDRIAQESWVVLQGCVKCIFYDIDDSILAEPILYERDASFTLFGGHNYVALEDNTRVLEFKTGKYEGQEKDKNFI